MEKQPDGRAPEGFDYDMWLGPAPKRPYNPNRSHWSWRWFYDYGGGLVTDWGVHMMDIVFLGMQQSDPISVACDGGIYALNDGRDTPDTMQAIYRFPNFLMNWETRFTNGRGLDGGRHARRGIHWQQGHAGRGSHRLPMVSGEARKPRPASRGQIASTTTGKTSSIASKPRAKPRSDIESMAKTTMCCHLANIAHQSGRTVRWDKEQQDVANRDEMSDCVSYQRRYRAPWKLRPSQRSLRGAYFGGAILRPARSGYPTGWRSTRGRCRG